jgi:hypothetical protein
MIAGMRTVGVALLLALAACPSSSGGECIDDRDCSGGEVCARDEWCTAASSVRQVTVTWTVNGAPATMAACTGHPDLFISFESGPGDTLGFSPVPCFAGQYNIDKLPTRYTAVELGVEGGFSSTKSITGATVTFDLR